MEGGSNVLHGDTRITVPVSSCRAAGSCGGRKWLEQELDEEKP